MLRVAARALGTMLAGVVALTTAGAHADYYNCHAVYEHTVVGKFRCAVTNLTFAPIDVRIEIWRNDDHDGRVSVPANVMGAGDTKWVDVEGAEILVNAPIGPDISLPDTEVGFLCRVIIGPGQAGPKIPVKFMHIQEVGLEGLGLPITQTKVIETVNCTFTRNNIAP